MHSTHHATVEPQDAGARVEVPHLLPRVHVHHAHTTPARLTFVATRLAICCYIKGFITNHREKKDIEYALDIVCIRVFVDLSAF